MEQCHSVDPFVISLACAFHHKFLIYPEHPLAIETAKAEGMECPDFAGAVETAARHWLSDPSARAVLNPQIAMLFRSYLEGFGPDPELEFSFCPRCGMRLADFEQDDVWVQGRVCANGHRWAYRGGRLGCVVAGQQFGVFREYSRENARSVATWWRCSDAASKSNVHASMRPVLQALE
jgi:hypothetical protein